jgi:hypothetical protein
MERQPESEQVQRLTVKTVDQVFIARALEGLGCSLFEAEALTELVKEVYFPWLLEPTAIQAGRLRRVLNQAGFPKEHPLDGRHPLESRQGLAEIKLARNRHNRCRRCAPCQWRRIWRDDPRSAGT